MPLRSNQLDTAHLLLSKYPYFLFVIGYVHPYLLISNFISFHTYKLRYVIHNSKSFTLLSYIDLIHKCKDGQNLQKHVSGMREKLCG